MKNEEYKKGQWLNWLSIRNANDGRRDSAIGYNESKLHLIVENTKNDFKVACGKEIQIPNNKRYKDPKVSKCCKTCINRAIYPFKSKSPARSFPNTFVRVN